jgi:hypothetical protein
MFLLQFYCNFLHWYYHYIGILVLPSILHWSCICFGIAFFLDLGFIIFSDFQLQIDRGIMVLDKLFLQITVSDQDLANSRIWSDIGRFERTRACLGVAASPNRDCRLSSDRR